jgi:iron complex transport system ATP-binding protein
MDAVLELSAVRVVREHHTLLATIDWTVRAGQRWVVLGPNGSGKTTLLQLASLYLHPSSGEVTVLGEHLGRTDVRSLRKRVGYVSAALASQLRPQMIARDVVMTARHAALEPWWHRYDHADHARAQACLDRFGVGALAERVYGTLSSGEQQRTLLARAFMNDPALVLLDEPTARLDLGGREEVVGALATLAHDAGAPPLVLVTHHVDEIPAGFSHVLLLRAGSVVGSGAIDDVLTAASLSATFGLALTLERRADGRFSAWAA